MQGMAHKTTYFPFPAAPNNGDRKMEDGNYVSDK
jgi:hypothetical protein